MIEKVKWFALLVAIESFINLVACVLMVVFDYDYIPLIICGFYLLGLWISLPKKMIVWTENHWLFEVQTLLSVAMLTYWTISKNILWLLLIGLLAINTVVWIALFFRHSKHQVFPIKELIINPDFYVAIIIAIAVMLITIFSVKISMTSNLFKHISFSTVNLVIIFETWWKKELLYTKRIKVDITEDRDTKSISEQ